jgi:hypothetical protein
MIDADTLSQQLADFLSAETEAEITDGQIAVLTPAEYPNRDGVVVFVEPLEDGGYVVSDQGEADSTLIARVGSRAIATPASAITGRLGVRFDGGQVTAKSDEASLAEVCWRVAQAAAAIAEAATFHRTQPPRDVEFVDLLASELRRHRVDIEREPELEGASGHRHKPALYIPSTETVIEPVGGERAWNVATSVYVEFGDLGNANGYTLFAVLDDREASVSEDVAGLLRQVGNVTRWSRHDEWIAELEPPRGSPPQPSS